ncbi:MAG: glycosyltransferase family 2 protein [Prevotella sp.]|nr:glycosyltransferase family 2 protein [Prevotella sp.]
MSLSKLISIITVNYNGFNDTCELIDTLPLNDDSLEVIVIDNASEKNEALLIEARYPNVKAIRSNTNLGFAGGNNLGINAATGKYLFFINNDTIIKDFNINVLINRLESSNEIGMVCPKIRFAWEDNPIQFAGYTKLSRITLRNKAIGFGEKDMGQHNTPHPTPYAHGAAMLVKREALEKVGKMPESYFLYYEEYDWSIMFRRAGYEIWYEPLFTIYHKESKSTGQNSPLKTYYITRNRLLLARRNEKTFIKYIIYCYLIGIVALRDILKYSISGNFKLAAATTKGIINFLKMK